MKKRAQFYIIAAVIISVIIVGLMTVTNYVTVEKEPVVFYDLSSQIKVEGAKVLDHKIYSKEDSIIPDDGKIDETEDFADLVSEYAAQIEPDSNLIFVFGNKEQAEVIGYEKKSSGEITVSFGDNSGSGEIIFESETRRKTKFEYEKSNEGKETKIIVKLSEDDPGYVFFLEENKDFLLIMTLKKEEETYVAD